jgi:hypothetical protein
MVLVIRNIFVLILNTQTINFKLLIVNRTFRIDSCFNSISGSINTMVDFHSFQINNLVFLNRFQIEISSEAGLTLCFTVDKNSIISLFV